MPRLQMTDDERYDGYIDIISYFNRSNSVYMQSGSNYKIFKYLPTAIADDILENYFNLSNIDIIISCDKKNNIIGGQNKERLFRNWWRKSFRNFRF